MIIKFLIFITSLFTINLSAADNYNIGDQLYIWAKSGLKLREQADKKSKALGVLKFGEEVTVIDFTDKIYNAEIIAAAYSEYESKKIPPLTLKGKWVKIISSSGQEGYIIDEYLLKLKPNKIKEQWAEPFILIKSDTTYRNSNVGGEQLMYKYKSKYEYGIKSYGSMTGVGGSEIFTIPDFTLDEVIILLSASCNNYENFTIQDFGKSYVSLHDDGICEYFFSQKKGYVELTISCSC